MCGIAGIIHSSASPGETENRVRDMIAVLRHRGPDADGFAVWSGGALGDARLSIIDLAGGAQPMRDAQQRWLLSYNGEIYNYQDINIELATHGGGMRTRSDSETLINAVAEWDAGAVARLHGMFAFCAVDTQTNRAILAVDRVGKKPLYYTFRNGALLFASELKALLAHPDVQRRIAPQAVDAFLSYHYIPAPHTIFEDIFKLPPAHVMIVEPGGAHTVAPYWSALTPRPRPESGWVEAALLKAVKQRLISDVPLGAFLSGGLDSTAVVAIMARTAARVKTFTIGFDEAGYDESAYAREVADVYGTEHHEERVRPDAGALLPRLVWHYDEPYADSSALPTFLLSRMTRGHVTVALSGDGGDEAFVGYERYRVAGYLRKLALLPRPLRAAAARAGLLALPAHPSSVFWRRARKLLLAMRDDVNETYIQLMTSAPQSLRAQLYTDTFNGSVRMGLTRAHLADALRLVQDRDVPDALLAADFHTYLPGDLLVKTDRASMAVSLEVRCPLLDHELLEQAYALPVSDKAPGDHLKMLLKDFLEKEPIPKHLLTRRKMGFGLPISRWFRGPLGGPSRRLLLSNRAVERGYFRADALRHILDAHARGAADHGPLLWSLVTFELWHRLFIDTLTLSPPTATLEDMI